MKDKFINFFKTTSIAKYAIITSSIVLAMSITAVTWITSTRKSVNAATNLEEENQIQEIEEILQTTDEPEEDSQAETEKEEPKQEEVVPPKIVTYKEKTVTIPESTVATVNSSEDAEKDKKTGGEEVSQEKAEIMFENVGQKSMGIDVSAHQGKINWAQVKQSGVDFAIIRCGFRGQTEGKIYEDAKFKTNVTGAIANGIKVGIYFYSTAINETEALEEAAWVINKIAPYNITYPVVYDFEDFGRYRCTEVNGERATKNALMFLNYVRSSGYEPMMYANKNDITNKMSRGSFSCKFWLAHYTEQTDYKGSFNMWQYTSKGKVPGISGNVDMDVAYFNYGTVAKPKHTHSYTTLVGEEKKPTCTEEGIRTLRCSCGETKTESKKASGHLYGEWQVETEATTEKTGIEKRICKTCKHEEKREISKQVPSPTPTPSIPEEPTPEPSNSPTPDISEPTPTPTIEPDITEDLTQVPTIEPTQMPDEQENSLEPTPAEE